MNSPGTTHLRTSPVSGVASIAAAVLLAACTGSISESGSDEAPNNPQVASPVPGAPPPLSQPELCVSEGVGATPLRRLTRLEYNNTVRALLGEDVSPAAEFTADEKAGPFPANYYSPISELQLGEYASAAAALAERVVVQRQNIAACDAALDEPGCATQFIQTFGRRAYRRPLDQAEVTRLLGLFELGRQGAGFDNGIKLVAQAMLESPHFLYLVEGPGPLTSHQLATRLSYFLWKGPPDAALESLADTGQLVPGPVLTTEVSRMLADERAQSMLEDFHSHWLALEELDKVVRDEERYPQYPALRQSIVAETGQFVSYVMNQGDGRLETLLTAPFSVIDAPLAGLYGVAAPASGFQMVAFDPNQRAGILTQAAFLTAHGREGSAPIHRGVTLREQFFCGELPPPPPDAGQTPEPTPTTTTRQRLEQHRANPACATCHAMIDGLGYGLEAYDAIGGYRTTENGQLIDDSGSIQGTDVDGTFKGARELGEKLVQSQMVQTCLTQHWFRYALGRMETEADRCALEALQERFATSGARIPELIVALIESPAFQIYRAEGL